MLSYQLPGLTPLPSQRIDRTALLAEALPRLSPELAVRIHDAPLHTSPLELVRGLIGLAQQLRTGSLSARVLIGSSILVLETLPDSDHSRCRLSLSQSEDTQAVAEPSNSFELDFRELLAEALALWQAWQTRVEAAVGDPVLLEAWRAQSADAGLLSALTQAWDDAWTPPVFAPGAADFASLFTTLSGQAFPFPELLRQAQSEGRGLYAGPRPDPDLGATQRLISWLAQASDQAGACFYIRFEDSRLIWVDQLQTPQGTLRAYFEDFAGPAGQEVWTPETLLTRLRYFGRHRHEFRDGLGLVYGEFSPRHDPLTIERIKRLNQALLLETLDARFQFQIAANADLSLGRDPGCDIHFDDLSLGRKQAVFHNHHGICTVEDAGSPSGTFLNDEAIHEPTALHEGDRLRLGGLVFAVTLPQSSRSTRQA